MKNTIAILLLIISPIMVFAQKNGVEINGWTNVNTFKCTNINFKNSPTIYSFTGNQLPNLQLQVEDFDDNLYFRGSWDNYNRSGLFVQHPDTGLELLFKEGDAAPNTGSSFSSFGFMHANAVGDYAFIAGLDDGRTGLFATVNGGVALKLLLIEGQIVDATGAGDMAVISGFEMPISSGGEDGHGMWLNNNGELLIEIAFDPSRALPRVTSGLYLLTIPEPTTLTLLALMSAAAMRRRKR